MKNMRKLENIVKYVLEESSEARDDDFILILNVYEAIDGDLWHMSFRTIMRDHLELKLPSFESITRARRKVQKEYPELQSSRKTKEVRSAEEKAYCNYYTESWFDMDSTPF